MRKEASFLGTLCQRSTTTQSFVIHILKKLFLILGEVKIKPILLVYDLCFIMALLPFSIIIILSHIPFNNQPQHRTYNISFGFSYENKISCIMDQVHFLIVHFSLIMDEIHSSSCSLTFINEVIHHCTIFHYS